MSIPESDDLSAKLRIWKVEPRVPSSFQHDVWQRIAVRQSAREEAFWPQLMQWLSGQLIRPQYAAALVVVSLSIGLGVAHLQARGAKVKHWKMLEERYAASVDPLSMGR